MTQVQLVVSRPGDLGDTETKPTLHQDATTLVTKTLGEIQKVLVGRGNLVMQCKKECSFFSSSLLD